MLLQPQSAMLDCDTVLYEVSFNENGQLKDGAETVCDWEFSDLKAGLNGNSFLTKSGNLMDVERLAILLLGFT